MSRVVSGSHISRSPRERARSESEYETCTRLCAQVVARRRSPSATSCSSTRSARPATPSAQPLLVVDGATVTSDASKLAKVKVTAEVVKAAKGPKITILKYKNKTGYRKRQGHRQPLTQVKITAIDA